MGKNKFDKLITNLWHVLVHNSYPSNQRLYLFFILKILLPLTPISKLLNLICYIWPKS